VVAGAFLALTVAAGGGDDDPGTAADEGPDAGPTTTEAPARAPAADLYDGYESALYGGGANWLCRPDTADVCDESLDTNVAMGDLLDAVEAQIATYEGG
jgi:hypothetical protein